jgi:hypothetical protein
VIESPKGNTLHGFSLHGVQPSDPVGSSSAEDAGSADVSAAGSLVAGSVVVGSLVVTGADEVGAGVESVAVLEGAGGVTFVGVTLGLVVPPGVGALVGSGAVGVGGRGAVELFDVVPSVVTAGPPDSVLLHAAKKRLEMKTTGRRDERNRMEWTSTQCLPFPMWFVFHVSDIRVAEIRDDSDALEQFL